MKGGWHRGRRLLKGWAAALGLATFVSLLPLAAHVLLEHLGLVSLTSSLVSMGVFVIALVPTMIACYKIIDRAHVPIEDREARAAGRPATAQVVRVERTRWRIKRAVRRKIVVSVVSPQRWEYRIFVRIELPGEPGYEAEIAEFLLSDEVPKKGDILDVKVHPRLPDVVVWTRQRQATGGTDVQAGRAPPRT